jgi:hypothetical protein
MTAITLLPTAPQSGMVNFRAIADAFFSALVTHVSEYNGNIDALNALKATIDALSPHLAAVEALAPHANALDSAAAVFNTSGLLATVDTKISTAINPVVTRVLNLELKASATNSTVAPLNTQGRDGDMWVTY